MPFSKHFSIVKKYLLIHLEYQIYLFIYLNILNLFFRKNKILQLEIKNLELYSKKCNVKIYNKLQDHCVMLQAMYEIQ